MPSTTKKYLKLLLYVLALYAVEAVLHFIFRNAQSVVNGNGLPGMAAYSTPDALHVLVYLAIEYVFFALLLVSFNPKKTLHIALINSGIYTTSYIGMLAVYNCNYNFLAHAEFYAMVAATFVSPFILAALKFRVTGLFTRINLDAPEF